MMPVSHAQSRVRQVTVLADAGSLPQVSLLISNFWKLHTALLIKVEPQVTVPHRFTLPLWVFRYIGIQCDITLLWTRCPHVFMAPYQCWKVAYICRARADACDGSAQLTCCVSSISCIFCLSREYLPNLIDDLVVVRLSDRLFTWLILRSQFAVKLQHSLYAASGLGPEQRLARTRTRALWRPGASTEPEGWGSAETLRRTRLDSV